ncbi:hypothetical protein GO003_011280 [Methylicorpusculum oleiharenae]|uniref:hypothetical protein n=1 Tax=Methylicorpusculum oleiharenae TaxID=1338687 RepID=UPI001359E61A|nr:hypothetical protein [Methylicorpusculum oleiharenae]MCD2450976.1 hypothetical protein [Methylicorpusculum oleiharenae]
MNGNLKESSADLISALPFHLTKPALLDWLNGLNLQDPYKACCQLNAVLNQLNGLSLPPKLKCQLYEQITPVADNLVEKIDRVLLDTKFPVTDDEEAQMGVANAIFRALFAGLLAMVSELGHQPNGVLTRQEQALVLYLALHASAQIQLLRKMVYAELEDHFWAKCYLVFKLAEELNLVDLMLPELTYKTRTIDAVFKNILIFEVCDCQSLSPREMKGLKELLESYVDYAHIEDTVEVDVLQNTYGFNFENESAPKRITEHDSFSRYLDVFPVAMQINKMLPLEPGVKTSQQKAIGTLLVKAVNSLSLVHSRKYTRLVAHGEISAYLGFGSIVNYLAAGHEKTITQKIPLPVVKHEEMLGFWKVPDLDLVPLDTDFDSRTKQPHFSKSKPKIPWPDLGKDHENKTTGSDAGPADGLDNRGGAESPEVGFEFIDTSIKGYGFIMKPQKGRVKVGELLGIKQNKGKRLEIGLLKRINKLDNQSIRLGIELIALESEAVWSISSSSVHKEGFWAVFIPKITALRVRDSLLLSSGIMKSGQTVSFDRKGQLMTFKLGRMMHTTSAGDHFELV